MLAAVILVCTMSALLTNCPVDVGNSGKSDEQLGNSARTVARWRRIVQAAQRTSSTSAASQSDPQVQVCALCTPLTSGSLFEAGSVRDTMSVSTDIEFSLSADNSISRRSHQQPVTMALRGPTGPFGCHGFAAPGSVYAR